MCAATGKQARRAKRRGAQRPRRSGARSARGGFQPRRRVFDGAHAPYQRQRGLQRLVRLQAGRRRPEKRAPPRHRLKRRVELGGLDAHLLFGSLVFLAAAEQRRHERQPGRKVRPNGRGPVRLVLRAHLRRAGPLATDALTASADAQTVLVRAPQAKQAMLVRARGLAATRIGARGKAGTAAEWDGFLSVQRYIDRNADFASHSALRNLRSSCACAAEQCCCVPRASRRRGAPPPLPLAQHSCRLAPRRRRRMRSETPGLQPRWRCAPQAAPRAACGISAPPRQPPQPLAS